MRVCVCVHDSGQGRARPPTSGTSRSSRPGGRQIPLLCMSSRLPTTTGTPPPARPALPLAPSVRRCCCCCWFAAASACPKPCAARPPSSPPLHPAACAGPGAASCCWHAAAAAAAAAAPSRSRNAASCAAQPRLAAHAMPMPGDTTGSMGAGKSTAPSLAGAPPCPPCPAVPSWGWRCGAGGSRHWLLHHARMARASGCSLPLSALPTSKASCCSDTGWLPTPLLSPPPLPLLPLLYGGKWPGVMDAWSAGPEASAPAPMDRPSVRVFNGSRPLQPCGLLLPWPSAGVAAGRGSRCTAATVGLPWVRVPVLSNTTVRTWKARSSASAPAQHSAHTHAGTHIARRL